MGKNQCRSLLRLQICALILSSVFAIGHAQQKPGQQSELPVQLEIVSIKPTQFSVDYPSVVKVNVSNPSLVDSPDSQLQIYLSADSEISADDLLLDEHPQPSMKPGGKKSRSWRFKVQEDAKEYWVYACGDWVADNGAEESTCSEAFYWAPSRLDLAMIALQISPDKTIPGNKISLTATWTNDEVQQVAPGVLRFRISRNDTISPSDRELAVLEIEDPASRNKMAAKVNVTLDVKPDEYWLAACIDPLPGERIRGNNCSFPEKIQVVENNFPDLVVDVIRVRPLQWSFGDWVDFYSEVLNIGRSASTPTAVDFFLSEDGVVDEADFHLGSTDVGVIEAESVSNAAIFVEVTQFPGVYWLLACAEPIDSENEVFNNCMTGPTVEVVARGMEQP